MSFVHLRYELLLMGRRVLLTPVLVIACFGLFAGLLAYLKVNPDRFLLAGLEMFLPLAAGVIITTIATQDPAIELQLTLPKQYRITTLRRLILLVCWRSFQNTGETMATSTAERQPEPIVSERWQTDALTLPCLDNP